MSGFSNTTRTDTINAIIEGQKKRIVNPYIINMKNPTVGNYFHINKDKSTLDIGSKLQYADVGKNSPFKFDKIINFYIYGLERLIIQLENGDFGLESNIVETDGFILPGTIVPTPGDFFSINALQNKVLFKITDVTPDTITNGANMFKVTMNIDQTDISVINENIVEEYNFLIDNVGTGMNTTIKSSIYDLVEFTEDILTKLKLYYKELFYAQRVDTFIWKFKDRLNLYDPFLIEFIIRNNILKNSEYYLFIDQKIGLYQTFGIDYSRTFFGAIERNKLRDDMLINPIATEIEQPLSILTSRIESYHELGFNKLKDFMAEPIEAIDEDLINNIKQKKLYDNSYKNIIIKYFLNQPISKDDIELLDDLDYLQSREYFYNIPIIIYILETKIINDIKEE